LGNRTRKRERERVCTARTPKEFPTFPRIIGLGLEEERVRLCSKDSSRIQNMSYDNRRLGL